MNAEEKGNLVTVDSEISHEQPMSVKSNWVEKLDRLIYKLNNILHSISSILLFFLMILTTVDVIGRYFFNKPITGTYEITGLSLAIIIFFSLGMTQLKKDHIEIDFLTNKMPATLQHVLYAISSLILFILIALTTWQLFQYGNRILLGNETSGDLGLPLYIFVFTTAIGSFCFMLTFLLDLLKSLIKVVKS